MALSFELSADELGETWLVPYHKAMRVAAEHPAVAVDRAGAVSNELSDLADISSGSYAPEYLSSGEPYLRVDNIRGHIANLTTRDVEFVDAADFSERGVVEVNDVLIARTGTLGKAVMATDRLGGCVLSQHVTRITLREDRGLRPEILTLYLNSWLGRLQLIAFSGGATRLELTHSSLAQVLVPFPPAGLQRELSNRLGAALENYYEATATLEELVARASHLVPGDPRQAEASMCYGVAAETLEDLWLPESYSPEIEQPLQLMKQGQGVRALSEIATVRRGKGTRTSDYDPEGTIPFLRTSSLINGSIDAFPDHWATTKTAEAFGQSVKDGDILYTIEGRIGEAALLFSDYPVVFKNHIGRLRLRSRLGELSRLESAGWLYLMLRSWVGRIQARKYSLVQGTIPGVAARVGNYLIPSPEGPEAKALAAAAIDQGHRAIDGVAALRAVQADFDSWLGDH